MSAQSSQGKNGKDSARTSFSQQGRKYKQILCISENLRRIVQKDVKGRQNRED